MMPIMSEAMLPRGRRLLSGLLPRKAYERLTTFIGFFMAIISFWAALGYTIYKLIYWKSFTVGIAPLVIGLFFFAGVQLTFLGIIGEYIGAIYARLFQRWLVIEKERVNFD